MPVSSFKIKKYINGVGFYGMIAIEVNSIDPVSSLLIHFDEINVEPEWHLSIEFGIRFFFVHFAKTSNQGFMVSVKRLHTMIVDSSPIIIVYITVKCLCEILNYQYNLIDLDEINGIFHIKK